MNILSALYTLLIGPLELFFEVLYSIAYRIVGHPGTAIIFLSLAMNFLVLPLYMRADEMQKEQDAREKKLQPWVKHIKKHFKGDERFMILQTYYRQNNYKPTQILRGSVSLLLEIPFFIAAYRFLSGLQLLNGVSFGPISDLGSPDGLIVIGGLSINLLPILMTLINIVSSRIYCKDAPLKSKIQLYGIALIFLVFLYNSPAGLVFYWTLNNLFSLCKNIVYDLAARRRAKADKEANRLAEFVDGKSVFAFSGLKLLAKERPLNSSNAQEASGRSTTAAAASAGQQPGEKQSKKSSTTGLFLAGCLFIAAFTGLFIPSMLIKSSPSEFIDSSTLQNPTSFILHSSLIAIGTFVIWFGVFYGLAGIKGRRVMSLIVWIMAGLAVVNFMCFGTDLGNLSSSLSYDRTPVFTQQELLLSLLAIVVVALVFYFLWKRAINISKLICTAALIAIVIMSGLNIRDMQAEINTSIDKMKSANKGTPHLTLSRDGQNVVVIMLDRAIGGFVPFIMNEKPELKEAFDGFTYYSNTLCYGISTNFAAPALYGGYEYVPEELNKRSTESLESKNDEALKVMPVMFLNEGYKVTVCDPTYAGYDWIPDLTIYDEYPEINKYITMDVVKSSDRIASHSTGNLERNFFCYSIFRIAPVALKDMLYNLGKYNEADAQEAYNESTQEAYNEAGAQEAYNTNTQEAYNTGEAKAGQSSQLSSSDQTGSTGQSVNSDQTGSTGQSGSSGSGAVRTDEIENAFDYGVEDLFLSSYEVLEALPGITEISSGGSGGKLNTFNMMSNDITHGIAILQTPDYTIEKNVDNTEYEAAHKIRYAEDGSTLELKTLEQLEHYHVNMAAFIQISKWLEYLKEEGVYDNTRIILVSDHGRGLGLDEKLIVNGKDVTAFQPLLMVKDFGSEGFKTDSSFMTNADVPTLATKNTISNPINPFTNKPITDTDKNKEQQVIWSELWQTSQNNGNKFLPADWFGVSRNVHDIKNWRYIGHY